MTWRRLRVATLTVLVGSHAGAALAQLAPTPSIFAVAPDATQVAADAPQQSPQPDVCATQRFSTVVRCIWHDVRQIGHREPLVWLAVGAALVGGSVPFDDEVEAAMRAEPRETWADVGAFVGQAGVQFGAPAVLYAVSRATGHGDLADFSVVLIRTQTMNGVFTRGLKFLPRARPYQTEAVLGRGSFPSGHTSASFATATVITRKWGWRAGVPAYAMATFVGVSRLQNVHYLSDVAFGAALGVAAGTALDMPDRRVALAPMVGPGLTGLSVSVDLGR